ncbi:LytTR family two component transcriptional regulator [Nonlabens dokdonensis]|uniref:Response regulator n=2 Tax=Nonlabens dokdonensis TaxID=328515 RepID=L7W8D9_NONDD|nr:LytTR family DNA-binding domain-containing protein [Nonlabens dokdonensis]AGC76071.1 response regulator [Nonlabens dokdonensis DSW-6]PZX43743.1 LytTR family two component transcriptional regulator [Nonlabens dokdonensis]
MKKVVVIDDERAGRDLIKEYLQDYPELIVLGEANNGVDAVKIIREFQPDLVFLDIQMPGLTGFEVLQKLTEIPQVIFSTAYDEYALKAFEVHAVDYLLKPYTKERFAKAVHRIKKDNEINNINSLADSLLQDQQKYPDQVLVNKNKKLVTLKVKDILWVEAYGDYSKIHSQNDVFVSNNGISTMEERLSPDLFLRVHRSSLINFKQIKTAEKYGKGYVLKMNNDSMVRVSRGYVEELKKLIF